jgi:hypothetical protein
MFTIIKTFILLTLFYGTTTVAVESQSKPELTSLVKLIANPSQYAAKKVVVRGFLKVEFENIALYLSEADAKNGVTQNALWLNYEGPLGSEEDFKQSDKWFKDLRKSRNKYADIEGTFIVKGHGHLGMYSGELTNIKVRK